MEPNQNTNAASSSSASSFVLVCCTETNFHPLGWTPSTSTTSTTSTTTTAAPTTSTTTSTTTIFTFITPFSTIVHRVYLPNSTYVYGTFTGYTEIDTDVSSSHIIKLNKNLMIDRSFEIREGLNGLMFIDLKMTKQPDNKLLVGGAFTSYNGTTAAKLVRINPNGTIDSAFNTNIGTGAPGGGDYIAHAALDSNNKIIVVGRFTTFNGVAKSRLVRLNSDGTIDNTFNVGTGFNNVSLDVDVLADNSMIVVGYFTTYQGVAKSKIVKITSTGAIDASFNVGTGLLPTGSSPFVSLARIPGETSFYVSGTITSYKGIPLANVTKLTSIGDIDPSFNPGTGFDAQVYSLEVIWGNKLLATGPFTMYNGVTNGGIVILNADGTILFNSTVTYSSPIIIGDTMFARTTDEGIKPIFVYTTTTTTTTAVPFTTAFSSIGRSSGLTACGNTVNDLFLFTLSPEIIVSTQFFTNIGATVPFLGNNLWYKNFDFNEAYQINNSGVVTAILGC